MNSSTISTTSEPATDPALPRGRAGWILVLLFASTVINYLDRQSLSILASTIQTTLHLSDLDYSKIVQLFLLPYTIAYLLAGRITDWLGSKKAMALFIVVWSAANLCTGFVRTGVQLGMARFVLGLGEPGNWVAGPKAITETISARARPMALSVASAGATMGAALSPPLISFLAIRYGWRSAFFVTGSLGMLWVIPWLILYPEKIGARKEKAAVVVAVSPTRKPADEWARWKAVFGIREVWIFAALRMLTDPVWYFYLFWFPKYLGTARHLNLSQLGKTSWVVYLAADAGSILAGYAVSRIFASGRPSIRAEQIVMTIMACFVPLGAIIPNMVHLDSALGVAAVVAFAHMGWQSVMLALGFHYFPPKIVATAWGVASAGSGLGGLISTNLIGHVITNFSYTPVFRGLALLHPLALLLLWAIRKSKAYEPQTSAVLIAGIAD